MVAAQLAGRLTRRRPCRIMREAIAARASVGLAGLAACVGCFTSLCHVLNLWCCRVGVARYDARYDARLLANCPRFYRA